MPLAAHSSTGFDRRLEEANAGDEWALTAVATDYRTGLDGRQDIQEAIKWYRLAAARGANEAQTDLGSLYEEGVGFAKDKVRAPMWYALGATKTPEPAAFKEAMIANGAAEKRNALAKEMSPAENAQAKAMASKRQASGYKDCG